MTGSQLSSVRAPRRLLWSRQAIGISLSATRAVAVERGDGEAQWVLDGPGVPASEQIAEVMHALLDRLPLAKGLWRRPMVVVALARDFAQQKHLFGFPPLRDRATANALVREGAHRFFRRTAEDLVTSDVEFDENGGPIAAAFNGEMIRVIRGACSSRGIRLVAIVPADSLPTDGATPPSMVDPEIVLAWRAGALAHDPARVRLNALTGDAHGRQISPARVRVAALVSSVSVALALAAPFVSARVVERNARLTHDGLRQREARALATSYELGRVSEALCALADRTSERRSMTQLLAHLAAALPPGSVLTHLQVDSAGGTLIALAPSADGVLKGISESTLIAMPEIVGPVTRETTGSREVERVTVRFAHRMDTLARERQ